VINKKGLFRSEHSHKTSSRQNFSFFLNKTEETTSFLDLGKKICGGGNPFMHTCRMCPQIIRSMIFGVIQRTPHRFGCPDASKGSHYYLPISYITSHIETKEPLIPKHLFFTMLNKKENTFA